MEKEGEVLNPRIVFQVRNKLVYLTAFITAISLFLSLFIILYIYNSFFYAATAPRPEALIASIILTFIFLHWGVCGLLGLSREVGHN